MEICELTLCKNLTPGSQVTVVGKVDSDAEGKFLSDTTAKVRVLGIESVPQGPIVEVRGKVIDERTIQLQSFSTYQGTELNFDLHAQLLELEQKIPSLTML